MTGVALKQHNPSKKFMRRRVGDERPGTVLPIILFKIFMRQRDITGLILFIGGHTTPWHFVQVSMQKKNHKCQALNIYTEHSV